MKTAVEALRKKEERKRRIFFSLAASFSRLRKKFLPRCLGFLAWPAGLAGLAGLAGPAGLAGMEPSGGMPASSLIRVRQHSSYCGLYVRNTDPQRSHGAPFGGAPFQNLHKAYLICFMLGDTANGVSYVTKKKKKSPECSKFFGHSPTE